MAALKSFGNFLLGTVGFAAFVLFVIALINGAAYVSAWAMPLMGWAVFVALALCLLVLPLAFFHRTRLAPAMVYLISSYVFGLCTWMVGLLITMQYWGALGVIIGLLIAGVGVVPIGMLAAAIKGSWGEVLLLFLGLALTYAARLFSFWMGEKYEAKEAQRRYNIIDSEALR